jgi:hypothetical protein
MDPSSSSSEIQFQQLTDHIAGLIRSCLSRGTSLHEPQDQIGIMESFVGLLHAALNRHPHQLGDKLCCLQVALSVVEKLADCPIISRIPKQSLVQRIQSDILASLDESPGLSYHITADQGAAVPGACPGACLGAAGAAAYPGAAACPGTKVCIRFRFSMFLVEKTIKNPSRWRMNKPFAVTTKRWAWSGMPMPPRSRRRIEDWH